MNKTDKILNINLILIMLFINFTFSMPANAEMPQLKNSNMDPLEIDNEFTSDTSKVSNKTQYIQESKTLNKAKMNMVKSETTTKMSAIVNKSKLIKFDEPVKRISLANPALVDIVFISPKEILINGKTAGTTSLIIWGRSSDSPVFYDLVVDTDNDAFIKEVKDLAPNENIDLKSNAKGVVLTGEVSSSILREKIKNLATAYGIQFSDISESPTPQVLLEVKVLEASRSFTKNLSATYAKGNLYNTYITNTSLTPVNATSGGTFGGTEDGIKYFLTKGDHNLGMLITAGEKKGLVKILADPKLVAKNGNEASFNAGQQIPVPSGIGMGGNVSYSYKDVGINVKFTPTILEKSKRVVLKVEPEVSEIDGATSSKQSDGSMIYGIKTRKVSTTVELNDGTTLVLAGLLKRTENTTNIQIPFLGDIPILGNFFKTSTNERDETELMILVTPKILGSTDQEGDL